MVLVIAHRGASGYCPENTLKSIEEAIKRGSDIVEIDLRMTKDNQIVLMHDESVDRTTNGKGYVNELTLQQLKELDAGDGEEVPLLTEVIGAFAENDIKFMLDVNSKGYERSLIEIIQKYRLEDRSIISGVHEPLKVIKSLDSRLTIAPSFDKASKEQIIEALAMSAGIFNCNYLAMTREAVDEAHKHGLQVIVWVVDEVETMHKMIEYGADGITTDYPDVLSNMIRIT